MLTLIKEINQLGIKNVGLIARAKPTAVCCLGYQVLFSLNQEASQTVVNINEASKSVIYLQVKVTGIDFL